MRSAAASAVVLTGDGRAFSAGADVTEFRGRDPAAILAYYRETGDVYERVAALPQPTLAAVHGYCLGGGLELALACDFRVAETSAAFGFPEVALGILPELGRPHTARAHGRRRRGRRSSCSLRERFSAAEALVVRARHRGGGRTARRSDAALALAERLAGLPPLAVSVTKQAAEAARESSREAALLIERLAYGMLAQTPEADEAAAAFVEKRPPRPAP